MRRSIIEQLESRRLLANPALVNITSWIGNTFPSKLAASATTWVTQHVQNYVNDLFVGRDGTVFTNSGYDEAGGAATVYKLDATAKSLTEIDAPPGVKGFAVTANATLVYRSNGDWLNGSPYGGSKASGVSRQFPGSDIRGLAASATEVYIADAAAGKIFVYDAALTTQLRSFAANKPSKLAVDPAGNLWVIENKNGPGARIACYSPTGTLITAITDVALPSALAIDPGSGQLLVADAGPSQQIRYYTNIDVKPTLVRTFGDYGGIFGGPTPGAVGPHRFNFMEGIGVDPSGNLYVANNGWARGLTIEAYAPNGTLISSVVGLSNIIDGAAYDATTDSIFGNDERYAIDWTAAPGKEATYAATLGNKLKYPNDPRYAGLVNTTQGVRVVQGHRLLAQLSMAGSVMTVYRQGQGETWVPSTMLNTDARFADTDAYPPNHPLKGTKFNTGWIWRDANGNGDFDAGEYQEDPLAKAGSFLGAGQIWMDNAGNIWEVNGAWAHALREFPLQGFDAAGNPIYTFSKVVDSLPPAPIAGNSLSRIQYDSDTDTMYLMGSVPVPGTTNANPYTLVRYDHWSNAPQRAIHAGFPLSLPVGINGLANNWPISWSVAGSYVFVGYSRQAPIEVYNISDGSFVGELQPSAQVGDTAWLDASQSVNAFKRANGEYEIFEEEDAGNKVVWYRWTPQQQPQQPPPSARVLGRQIFYNNSALDGNDPAANSADDAAIDSTKAALLPGQAASAANLTSSSRGITGLMIDMTGLPTGHTLTAADFSFTAGSDGNVGSWLAAAAPSSVVVRHGAGSGGSDRVELTWADGAILNQWLRVTVSANANTGLSAPDVFYFGNLAGDANGSGSVTGADVALAKSLSGQPAVSAPGVGSATLSPADFNGNGQVTVADVALAKANQGHALTFFSAPVIAAAAPAAVTATAAAVAAIPPPSTRASPVSPATAAQATVTNQAAIASPHKRRSQRAPKLLYTAMLRLQMVNRE